MREIVRKRLGQFPCVALLGPRQVGKTTLARDLAEEMNKEDRGAIYLDLENSSDLRRLDDARAFFDLHSDKLIILDEIHRAPEIFSVIRGVVDDRRRSGQKAGHFLLLGSAALDLLKQSSESLAGRIINVEMTPFQPKEVIEQASKFQEEALSTLWVRGGFPNSFLAEDDEESFLWRQSFIKSYLERDVPQFGVRVPAQTLERFWTMLAHKQGSLLNAQQLANSLGVNWNSAAHYLDLMVDLLLIRRLQPWMTNSGKRLVKSPKVYVRDSGLLHSLLNIPTMHDLLGHPVAGASWEGHVIEAIISAAPQSAKSYFYRTSAGAEVDLVIELSATRRWVFECKRSTAPQLSRGFYSACEDLEPERKIVVYSGRESFPMRDGVEAMSVESVVGVFDEV